MLEPDIDDVFGENSDVVVDCDVLEASKENVQPLASGRRVTALSSILQTPHGQRESKLSATRNRLRINVEIAIDDPDDDPLEAYCRLVYWTVENYPQGHCAESGLLELLEEATRRLKDDRDGKWRMELKYLKLWVLYASFVEKPAMIYKFLLANEIGTGWALFYEEYATVLERNRLQKDADAVYILGIARHASPLDHLKGRYREFQKRMMSSAVPAAAPPETETVPPPTRRRVLGDATSSSSASAPGLSARPRENIQSPPPPSGPSRLQVFVDPSRAEGIQTNPWPDLGTRKGRIKENIPEVKQMEGTTIRQPGRSARIAAGTASGSGTASRIVPYRDPTRGMEMPPPPVPKADMDVPSTPKFTPFRDEPDTTTPASASTSKPDTVMKTKVGKAGTAISESEALRKNPLKNYEWKVDDD